MWEKIYLYIVLKLGNSLFYIKCFEKCYLEVFFGIKWKGILGVKLCRGVALCG